MVRPSRLVGNVCLFYFSVDIFLPPHAYAHAHTHMHTHTHTHGAHMHTRAHTMHTHTWQDLANAQEAFVHLLGQLNPECKIDFLEWVCREYNPSMEPGNAIAEEPESGQSGVAIIICLRSEV